VKESTTSQVTYFQNLDGWRFVAFFTVFVSHAALFLGYDNQSQTFGNIKKYVLVSGDVGVSFFFVLSGFLITYLLLRERERTGGISLKNFYIRRILRIWPVYFTTLIVGFFVLPYVMYQLIGNEVLPFLANPPLEALPKYIFFLANFSLAFNGGASVPTDILWSISVEEQFYLVWPWVLSIVPEKYLTKVLYIILIIAAVYRFVYASTYEIVAYSTFSVMSDLAVGCLLAIFVINKSRFLEGLKNRTKWLTIPVYIFTAALIMGRHAIFSSFVDNTIMYSLSAVFIPLTLTLLFAFIIFEQNESVFSLFKAGRSRLLTNLGKISYGLYSYHMIAISIVMIFAIKLNLLVFYSSLVRWILFGVASLLVAVLLSLLSYNFVEKKFLNKKPI
jgi:peptidoglycan/LPS O-acetylase OafA/YrhL